MVVNRLYSKYRISESALKHARVASGFDESVHDVMLICIWWGIKSHCSLSAPFLKVLL